MAGLRPGFHSSDQACAQQGPKKEHAQNDGTAGDPQAALSHSAFHGFCLWVIGIYNKQPIKTNQLPAANHQQPNKGEGGAGEGDAGRALRQTKRGALKLDHAAVGNTAEFLNDSCRTLPELYVSAIRQFAKTFSRTAASGAPN